MKRFSELSREEEERALEVHRRVIVINGYGGPWFAGVRKRRDKGEKATFATNRFPEMQKGGVDVVVGCFGDPRIAYAELEEGQNKISLATKVDDIKRAKREEKGAIILIWDYSSSGWGDRTMRDDLNYLRVIHKLGYRVFTLSHNRRNLITDGCSDRTACGLSSFGVDVVKELNRLGMIIDISHVSETGVFDTLELTKDPIIATHSNTRTVWDHPRNLNDEQIKGIAESGGLIGLNFFPAYLGKDWEKTGIEDLLDHLDYIVRLVGVDHIGLGPDLLGEENLEAIKYSIGVTDPTGKVPARARVAYPKDIEDITKFPNVTKGLVARGYSDEEIEKILGGNFLRVLNEVSG